MDTPGYTFSGTSLPTGRYFVKITTGSTIDDSAGIADEVTRISNYLFSYQKRLERAIFRALLFVWDLKNLSYFAEKNSEVRLSSIGEKIWNRNSL